MAREIHFLAFSGSTRADSFNRMLLGAALTAFAEKLRG